jgi:hypothetical protein
MIVWVTAHEVTSHNLQHQCPDDQKELLVVRGKYGLEVALAYLVHFLKAPGVEENYSQAVNILFWTPTPL